MSEKTELLMKSPWRFSRPRMRVISLINQYVRIYCSTSRQVNQSLIYGQPRGFISSLGWPSLSLVYKHLIRNARFYLPCKYICCPLIFSVLRIINIADNYVIISNSHIASKGISIASIIYIIILYR